MRKMFLIAGALMAVILLSGSAAFGQYHGRIFSGGTVGDPATAHNGVMANAKEFNRKVRLIFQSCGSKERPENVKASYEQLKAAGIETAMYVSEGTAHECQTWRRSLREFASLLFRD